MQEETTTYLTPEGKLKLEAELEDLKTNKRRELAERLNFAIKQGDLSENADYHKAKEDQGFLEGRIKTIEAMLRNLVIVEEARAETIALFEALGEQDVHVVVSSHILHEVDRISDQVILLSQGYVVAEGAIEGVRSEVKDHPIQVMVRCDNPRALAARLGWLPV